MNMKPEKLNGWWAGQPDELKRAFTLFPDKRWEECDLFLRSAIHNYCCLKEERQLPEDEERPMLGEIVCELADMELCRVTGKPLEDMCDEEGAFLEEYQDRFDRIYDTIEREISDYMYGLSKHE